MDKKLLFIISLLLIVGCSRDSNENRLDTKSSTSTTSKKYSLSELQTLLEDKTQSKVKELFGPPDNIYRGNTFFSTNGDRHDFPYNVDVWDYYPKKKILWNEITEKYHTLKVFFVTGKVISVSSPFIMK